MGIWERDDERMPVTVLFRNASARCCAPITPIRLLLRFSWVSVCVKTCIWGYEREMTREWRLPCYFVMRQPDVLLLCLQFHFQRDLALWVSVWKSAYGNMREMTREWWLPCYFVIRQPDVVLRELRFDCSLDLVRWVSVWKSADGDMIERWRENGGYRVIS